VWQRYRGERCKSARAIWCEHAAITEIAAGESLIVALRAPAIVRWGFNGWRDIVDAPTTPNSLGLHVLHIDTSRLTVGQKLDFTFRYSPGDNWIGADFHIDVAAAS
jgi:glucoamylase